MFRLSRAQGYESTHSLNSITLLLRNTDAGSSWWKRRIIVTGVLAQQLQELFWVGADDGSQLWITSGNLLENRLKHCWLLLNHLAKLLELGVISEKVKISKTTCSTSGDISTEQTSRSSSTCTSTSSTTTAGSTSCSSCGLEEITRSWVIASSSGGAGRRR